MVIEINTNTLGTDHINQYALQFTAFRLQSDTNNTKGNKKQSYVAWYDI